MPVPSNLPEGGKKIFESVMESLKGKTNKRTGKPYTDEERGKIAWSAVKRKYSKKADGWELKSIPEDDWETCFNSSPLEFKSQDGNYYFSGYLSTFDLDLVNDIVSPDCMKDMLEQIKMGMNGTMRSFKGSPDHDVYWYEDPQLKPISKITDAILDAKGILIKGMFNSAHPEFNWEEIQKGFYDGLSIEYKATDFSFKDVDNKKIRVLNKVQLKGYGHTPRPANPYSTLTDVFIKSLELEEIKEEESIKKDIESHLHRDIKEYQMMISEDEDFLKKLSQDCPICEKKSEDEIMADKKEEVKSEPQPQPVPKVEEVKTIEVKTEIKPETKVEEKKSENLEETITRIVKDQLKSMTPENKAVPNVTFEKNEKGEIKASAEKFEEIKSKEPTDLVGYVTKGLGLQGGN